MQLFACMLVKLLAAVLLYLFAALCREGLASLRMRWLATMLWHWFATLMRMSLSACRWLLQWLAWGPLRLLLCTRPAERGLSAG
jgi:hypothetical protein